MFSFHKLYLSCENLLRQFQIGDCKNIIGLRRWDGSYILKAKKKTKKKANELKQESIYDVDPNLNLKRTI